MPLRNTAVRFGTISIFLHWIMAMLIVALLIQGMYMTSLSTSPWKLTLFRWHKEFGMMVLMLVILRVIWRTFTIRPTLESLPSWEKLAAQSMHWLFYVMMFVQPLTGWLLSSASGLAVSFFGVFIFPDLIAPSEEMRMLFTLFHQWLAYLFIAMICLHVAASLKHHFIDKDDILRRIL